MEKAWTRELVPSRYRLFFQVLSCQCPCRVRQGYAVYANGNKYRSQLPIGLNHIIFSAEYADGFSCLPDFRDCGSDFGLHVRMSGIADVVQ